MNNKVNFLFLILIVILIVLVILIFFGKLYLNTPRKLLKIKYSKLCKNKNNIKKKII